MSIDLQDNWAKDKRKDHKEKIGAVEKQLLIVYNKK